VDCQFATDLSTVMLVAVILQ